MCLILLAWQTHPDFPLLVAANRDEFHERPTQPAHWWPDAPEIYAGRDLRAGGTWTGITRSGRFAALTNIRAPAQQRSDAHSRGQIVTAALQAPQIEAFLLEIEQTASRYNGFNLLVGDREALWHFNSEQARAERVAPGIHGLSNANLDTPWPKLTRGSAGLADAVKRRAGPEALFTVLSDEQLAPDDALPDTGVPLEWERWLSAIRINAPGYGTRSQSVVLLPREGEPRLIERVLIP
ncbi:NRDE family protein [Niveibacterium sp.]|uniref:NRDE family protein n=1 Tax=Niveibacterium sp. TaxID=2017444 RepID=UPI0035AE9C0D